MMGGVRRRLAVAALLPVLLAALAPCASAAQSVTGTIRKFECGDNCYLTIKVKRGKELTGLCTADACRPWNEQAAMPRKLIGRKVLVTLGTGQQVDGSGNVMGDFTAFTKIEFVK